MFKLDETCHILNYYIIKIKHKWTKQGKLEVFLQILQLWSFHKVKRSTITNLTVFEET